MKKTAIYRQHLMKPNYSYKGNEPLLQKIYQLEADVKLLKENSASPPKPGKIAQLIKIIITHWGLISFAFAMATLFYVKVNFDIDYFEDYRNASTTKKISEVYRELGDRLMVNSEWKAAEDAYLKAVEINPNNIQATYGVVKAQIFAPMKGESYAGLEVVEAKLDYLLTQFPDDYHLYFLKGVLYTLRSDNPIAIQWLQKSIDKNSNFSGSYIQLGQLHQQNFNLEESIKNYSQALKIDPNNSLAHGLSRKRQNWQAQ